MLAETNQIPVKKSETIEEKLETTPKGDHVYAEIRRLKQRMSEVEKDTSTLRRDLNATRKKVYEDEKKSPPVTIPKDQYFPGTNIPIRGDFPWH